MKTDPKQIGNIAQNHKAFSVNGFNKRDLNDHDSVIIGGGLINQF